ncbi:Glucuronyl hydrolase [Winogradskyella psychrotolerans RS-3]|uniref:Glucuronyl hydrolase n=1 Tax=Winogradskyella psychrotolerans RS-3 TaxID=641526 RepID=S7XDR7_9FLAO|nr:Glucuronyl hydrolase [Winogradskyella psychrotolerans RS-3]
MKRLFILKHSVGAFPANSEVDVPLIYADYYYVEAMIRLKNIYLRNLK